MKPKNRILSLTGLLLAALWAWLPTSTIGDDSQQTQHARMAAADSEAGCDPVLNRMTW